MIKIKSIKNINQIFKIMDCNLKLNKKIIRNLYMLHTIFIKIAKK